MTFSSFHPSNVQLDSLKRLHGHREKEEGNERGAGERGF